MVPFIHSHKNTIKPIHLSILTYIPTYILTYIHRMK